MNKVANYLQEHIVGEVLAANEVRKYFSTDGGVFEVMPALVVYPKNVQDVRKVARFSWQLAEKGHNLPITARGRGSDQGGAAIGRGVIMVFPAHMNRLLELDNKRKLARIQPGMNYRAFQESMHSHSLFLPPYPSSIDYATLGGAIANNTAGEKTVKYGSIRNYVENLEVVLANGEVIQTGRINKKELEKRKGLTTFEGEIYRQLDGLITDNWELIQTHLGSPKVSKNSAGYALGQVKLKDGSIDLTPLFVGSQGTLGIVTEAILRLEQYTPETTLFKINLENLEQAVAVVQSIMRLEPSALEVVDSNLLGFLDKVSPNRLKGLVEKPFPSLVLLAEFDDVNSRAQAKKSKKVQKWLQQQQMSFVVTQDAEEQQRLWSIRHSAAAVIWHVEGNKKALPIIEDGVVPREKFGEFVKNIYDLFQKYGLQVAIWGHAGDANLHLQPFLDLSLIGDRQKVFKIMEEYYDMVLKMGGSTCGEHNDGRLRAPFLPKVYGAEVYELFRQVKRIFDPYNILNPGVKIDVNLKDLVPILRHEYSMEHLADHLPRS
ncbi:MAG TPA: FAD-binding oxidoreductase [Candidatus Saccharimonadales bacterium]|nr:FAD-binding oxidoreductase [Candidatus Saccharimonadales bacterium]